LFPYFNTRLWFPQPFAPLVGAAIAVWFLITSARAGRERVPRERIAELNLWVIGASLLVGHVASFAFEPWAAGSLADWLNPLSGMSSFGALTGAAAAGFIFFRRHSIPRRNWFIYFDAGAFAMPFAWAVARTGCYLVHDHPGIRTVSWLGVRYPGGTRFDLGLLELLFSLMLGAAFVAIDHFRPPRAFFCGVLLISYGAFRLAIESLRVDPQRYFGVSMETVTSAALIGAGLVTLMEMRRASEDKNCEIKYAG
jgi:phosphatidylglycerol---prolipoprotein diacylglyceryl transferase